MSSHPTLEALRSAGWIIESRAAPVPLLTPEQGRRYATLPRVALDFLGRLAACHNAREDAWLFTPSDYQRTDPSSFRWNEQKLMSQEAAGATAEARAVESFWDAHLPFMMSVRPTTITSPSARYREPDTVRSCTDVLPSPRRLR